MVAAILCVLFLVVTLTPTVDGPSKITGTITVGQVTCRYAEIKRNSGPGPRGLRLFSCENEGDNMNLDCSYYGGNPHDCSYYNKNQPNYYNLLAESAMNSGQPCRIGNISERKCGKTYQCEDEDCK